MSEVKFVIENKLNVPFNMPIDKVINLLLERKKLGDDCYIIYNGIILSSQEFNTTREGLVVYKNRLIDKLNTYNEMESKETSKMRR